MADVDFELEYDSNLRDAESDARRVEKLRRSLSKLDRMNGKVETSSDRMGRTMRGGSGLIANVGKLGGALLAGAAAYKTFAAGAQFAGDVLGKARFAERSRKSLELLTGSATAGEHVFQRSISLARQFGLNIENTTQSFQKLLSQQFSFKESEKLIKLTADMRAIGATADESKRALVALTQIRGKGRLQGDELIQLAEAGVSRELIFQSLEKQLGVGRNDVRKLQEQGKVSADMALEAFEFAILQKTKTNAAGQAGTRFAQETLDGMLGVFATQREKFVLDIAEAAAPALKKLGRVVVELGDAFSNQETIDKFGAAFGRIGDTLERIGPKVVEGLVTGLDTLANVLDRLTIVGPAFIEGFFDKLDFSPLRNLFQGDSAEGAKEGARELGGQLAEQFTRATDAAVSLANAVDRLMGLLDTFAGARQFGQNVVEGMFDADKAKLAGAQLVNGIAEGIGIQSPFLQEKVKQLADQASGAFKSAAQIQSPSRLFEKHGVQLNRGLAMGIERSAGIPSSAMAGVTGNISATAGLGSGLNARARGGSVNQTFSPSIRNSVRIDGSNQSPQEIADAIAELNLDGVMEALAMSKPAAGLSFNGEPVLGT